SEAAPGDAAGAGEETEPIRPDPLASASPGGTEGQGSGEPTSGDGGDPSASGSGPAGQGDGRPGPGETLPIPAIGPVETAAAPWTARTGFAPRYQRPIERWLAKQGQ
ncbi:MAG: hypothetical protein R3F17_07060, partial [Planctomycetota bacterium]